MVRQNVLLISLGLAFFYLATKFVSNPIWPLKKNIISHLLLNPWKNYDTWQMQNNEAHGDEVELELFSTGVLIFSKNTFVRILVRPLENSML